MDSIVVVSINDSYCLDRASALVFSEPGRYVTMKSNLVKHKDHLALHVVEPFGGFLIFKVAMIG